MIYILLLIIVVRLAYINNRLTSRTRKCFLVFLGLFMILLMGLRYRVGIDTLNYMTSYDSIPDIKDFFRTDFGTSRFEPGYTLLCAVCRTITPDFWLLQLVHSFILTTCFFIFIYRNTNNPFIGIGVYIILCWLYFNTEIIRESLAISLFLLNYKNLKTSKWGRYIILSCASICFHYSAIITLFFPFVRYLRVNFLYVMACVAILGVTPYLESLNQMISIVSIADRVGEHLGSATEYNMNWRIANMIRYTIVPLVALVVYRRFRIKSEFTPYILLSILFGVGAFAVPIIFSRLANYTLPFVIVYVANLLESLSYRTIIKHSLLVLLLSSQMIYYSEMFYAWFPYESIFSGRTVEKREALWYNYFG